MEFEYNLNGKIVFFTDTLYDGKPCVYNNPRNHESLFYVTNGHLLYEKEGEKEIVPNGTVGYIARGSRDKTSPYNCESVSYIAVNFNFTETDFTQTLNFKTLCSTNPEYRKLFEDAFLNYALKKQGGGVICKGILLQIIGKLYSGACASYKENKKYEKIHKAIDIIAENYGDAEFKISKLSEALNISDKHFRNLFLELNGKTPYDYLVNFRLEQAKILLENTEKQISEIAVQCGFSDVYSFSHCFKRHVGISPLKYKGL